MNWTRLNGAVIDDDITNYVGKVILSEQGLGNKLKVCIGTDSQVKGETIEFATVIVFLREKKGGFMLVHRERRNNQIGIKERMITEVAMSVDIAYKLCDTLTQLNVELEVHADINTDPSFKSNVAFKEAMGYILGMGYTFKAKPDAFASSCCADKAVE